MALTVPCLAVRGSNGLTLSQGPPSYLLEPAFTRDDSKACKTMLFSPEGRYFAWTNGINIQVALCETWKVIAKIPRPKVSYIAFSPQGNYIMTWETFIATPTNPQGSPNLHIWKSDTGELIKSLIQKKQSDWKPQWSSDEKLFGMLVNNDIVLYEDVNLEKIVHRINSAKIGKFSIAPGEAPYHILCYMPGKPGQASMGRIFQYPKFEASQFLATKSFFQSDKVDIFWNPKGTSALLLASTEVDKTSYYGKQTLHYLDIKGETALVSLSKEGPIHAVEWSPKNTEFCVIYGFMPSKATLFNLKCEAVFEFGVKHRNSIYYNPQGNILLLAGFGNLQGEIELWDTNNKKLIAKTEAADTTLLQWSPNGEHFMTATTAPRLRVGNGYKIWHYTGTLLYERFWNKQDELWEVLWQKYPPSVFPEKTICYKAVEGIAPSQPQASKQAYRPPSARGRTINFNLHDDDDAPSKRADGNPSKAYLKSKKKREAKKAKKELEALVSQTVNDADDLKKNNVPKSPPSGKESELTDDADKNKKIRKIKSKLDQITKLKEQQSSGKHLEINQLDKIKKEAELLKELQDLSL